MTAGYQYAQHSIPGARSTNQDRVGVAERPNGLLMIVADGLGGHVGGELAAETLVSTTLRLYGKVHEPVIANPSAFLALTLMQAHKTVVAQGRRHQPPIEPRTTCIACLIQNGYAYWAHVGDSRLYHFSHGQLRARTEDHTTVEMLRRDGVISEDEMRTHPHKGRLLQSLGGGGTPSITLGPETKLAADDMLLLCSDGLWEALTASEIAAYMHKDRPLQDLIEDVLAIAERRMGTEADNVSAVCLRWQRAPTIAPPLQQNQPAHVAPGDLWPGATKSRSKSKASKVARRAPAAVSDPTPPDAHLPIAREIEELDKYLKQFEGKK